MFEIGQIVKHYVFGEGKILKIDRHLLTIQFEDGCKTIYSKYFTGELKRKNRVIEVVFDRNISSNINNIGRVIYLNGYYSIIKYEF